MARGEPVVLYNLCGVDAELVPVLFDGNAFEPRSCGIEHYALFTEVAAGEAVVGGAFHRIHLRAVVRVKIATESVLLHYLPYVVVLDGGRGARVGEEYAGLGAQVDGGAHHEVRLRLLAFGVEYVEGVGLALGEPERVEVHGSEFLGVLPTDIDHQAVVDEHPHVVVAVEFKVLAGHVFELRLDLHGEPEVVVALVAAQGIVVDVLYGTRLVEPAEVVEEEQPAFLAAVVPLAEPEAVVGQFEFQVAAGGVGVLLAVCAGVDDLG